MNLLLFACFVGIAVGRVSSETYCDNDCQPNSSTEGKFFCVQSNANKYTQCVNGHRHEFNCPAGLNWDSSLSVCNWPSASAPCNCGGPVIPTAPPVQKTTTKSQHPVTTPPGPADGYSRVCYYTNWSQYRPGAASFKPDNLDPHLCTHIIYAFLKFDTSGISFDEWNDDVTIPKLLAMKSVNPSLKVLASIGGGAVGTGMFRQIIVSSSSRSTFNRGAISFLRANNFDGLDVDFEFPGAADRGSPPEDKPLYMAWMQSLHDDFANEAKTSGKSRLLLTAAIGSVKKTIDEGYDIPALSRALDFISVMTYDFHGSWDSFTGHQAPLYRLSTWQPGSILDQLTTSYSINYLISLGAPPSKLVVGIPLYGRSYRLANAANNGIGAPAIGPGTAGKFTREAGVTSYYENCMLAKCTTKPFNYVYNTEWQAPYMYAGNDWISTEDVNSVKAKAEFAKQKGLGGVVYWAVDFDDFGDMCQNGVKSPLMRTVYNVLKGLPPPSVNNNNKSPAFC